MPRVFENKNVRSVRIFSDGGTYDGLLNLGILVRTLDELNSANRAFLALNSPSMVGGELELTGHSLILSKHSVLFVVEMAAPQGELGQGLANVPRAQYQRLAVRLRVHDYLIEGYVHAPEQMDLLSRLNQASRPFIALTSVSVSGSQMRTKAPFLAVNIAHIASAQTAFRIDAVLGKAQQVDPAGSMTPSSV